MEQFSELYGCSSNDTLRFFYTHLHGAVPDSRLTAVKVYTASILAHYAQVSSASQTDLPLCANLSVIYDMFVLKFLLVIRDEYCLKPDSEILEIAGSQTLLMVGFFQDQMRCRYNLNVFERYGQTFFSLSAQSCQNRDKRVLLYRMSDNFNVLAKACCKISRNLRNEPYLIRLPKPPPTAS